MGKEEDEEDLRNEPVFPQLETAPTQTARKKEGKERSQDSDPKADYLSLGELASRKRKGNELLHKLPKKVRTPKARHGFHGVRIQEPEQEQGSTPHDYGRGVVSERRSKSNHDRAATKRAVTPPSATEEVTPHTLEKFLVTLNDKEIKDMVRFTDERMEEGCLNRIKQGKETKSGRIVDQPSLSKLKLEDKFLEYVSGIGFDWLLELQAIDVPYMLAMEFFTSFKFWVNMTDPLEPNTVCFRLNYSTKEMSLDEWSQ